FNMSFSQYLSIKKNKNNLISWVFDSSFNLKDTNPNYNYNYGARAPRGYTGKVYEGANMIRVEGEYKHYFKSILNNKLGIAVFTGIGVVYGGKSRVGNYIPDSLSNSEGLPHIGTGIRYKVIPKQS